MNLSIDSDADSSDLNKLAARRKNTSLLEGGNEETRNHAEGRF